MSQILDRVVSNVHLCGVEVAFTGTSVASIIDGWQPFYNQTFENANFQKAYATLTSIEFTEESIVQNGNTAFKQKVQFRFPANDANRANRIQLLHKIKFIKAKITDGRDIVIGRNDVFQNTLPTIKSKANEQFCEIEVEAISMTSAGFTPNPNRFGLPSFIPLSF